jgi:U6 snRNA-associated Sm-like protein LSm4
MAEAPLFPSMVLTSSLRKPVAVELKTGVTCNGLLSSVDKWMNVVLVEAVLTSPDGEKFHKSREVVLRGNSIRTIRVVAEALRPPPVKQQPLHQQHRGPANKSHRTEKR